MPAWLDFLSPTQWGILAAALGAVGFINLDKLSKIRLPSFGDAAPTDDDAADLAALKRLNARYAACPEGKAALKTLAMHFFHEG